MRAQISPFYVMEALSEAEALAATGVNVIHLSVGQPSARLPTAVITAAQDSLARDNAGYTHSLGLLPLREAIARFYQSRYGVDVSSSRIAVTVGSSVGCALALMATFEAGQRVGISVPYYPAYPNMLRALGLEPVFCRTDASTQYQPTLAILEQSKDTLSGLMIASPSNPAGTVIAPDALAGIAQWCEANAVTLISDEIYHGITYGDAMADTALRYSENAIIINSFSKYFLMPGFRLGWVIMPEHLIRNYECLLQNFVISPPTLSQHVALAMLQQTNMLDREVHRYAKNRDILLDAVKAMGMSDISTADGAFYIYANSSSLDKDSKQLCTRLLHEAHVSIVPGCDFDHERGAQMVRLSYCGDTARIIQAAERMVAWHKMQKSS